MVANLKDSNHRDKFVADGVWLACSLLGTAYYRKLLLIKKVRDIVVENIDMIKFRYRFTLYLKYKDNFSIIQLFINNNLMGLTEMIDNVKILYPECFI